MKKITQLTAWFFIIAKKEHFYFNQICLQAMMGQKNQLLYDKNPMETSQLITLKIPKRKDLWAPAKSLISGDCIYTECLPCPIEKIKGNRAWIVHKFIKVVSSHKSHLIIK